MVIIGKVTRNELNNVVKHCYGYFLLVDTAKFNGVETVSLYGRFLTDHFEVKTLKIKIGEFWGRSTAKNLTKWITIVLKDHNIPLDLFRGLCCDGLDTGISMGNGIAGIMYRMLTDDLRPLFKINYCLLHRLSIANERTFDFGDLKMIKQFLMKISTEPVRRGWKNYLKDNGVYEVLRKIPQYSNTRFLFNALISNTLFECFPVFSAYCAQRPLGFIPEPKTEDIRTHLTLKDPSLTNVVFVASLSFVDFIETSMKHLSDWMQNSDLCFAVVYKRILEFIKYVFLVKSEVERG
ncbi:hypothetical protein EIN_426920 [Entamoeba invadens IP1]|uniref:Uncharacterized protein n=1 Tax=Entamoeba invadens IP1 TaxID=370355 RepID=L7FLD2_ENTIV|nr:hypothetical protein EIN_426920 [Entamoeba invadens IP1]ELP87705.1 hypothetical protein EIN_426920 [Entamoeba invadens IP1]|eukprot:XP_004254476.1 hypothetical protein EIN_426920 [Entamoeba invadens IP1]